MRLHSIRVIDEVLALRGQNPECRTLSPEMALHSYMLKDALHTIYLHKNFPLEFIPQDRKNDLRLVLEWVQDRERSGPFSFTQCCEAAGLDPDSVQERVLAGKIAGDVHREKRGSRSGMIGISKRKYTRKVHVDKNNLQ